MKLRINFDFFEKIKDVKEPHNPLKIIRNNKEYIVMYLSFWTTFDLLAFDSFNEFISKVLVDFAIIFGSAGLTCILELLLKKDDYAKIAVEDLKGLVSSLNSLNLNTNYELLLESQLSCKEYKIVLNKNKIPQILESKYILVPTYNYNNQIKDVSVLQEHVIGSKDYELSLQSPRKSFKHAYSH